MSTVPEADLPDGDLRIWASNPDQARAERVARELEQVGVASDRIAVAADPGTTEGPLATGVELTDATGRPLPSGGPHRSRA